MKKDFEFVAMAREGNIHRQRLFHDRNLRGIEFNLLDRVNLKKDEPRVGVSKKFKFRFDGLNDRSHFGIKIGIRGDEALQNKARGKGTV